MNIFVFNEKQPHFFGKWRTASIFGKRRTTSIIFTHLGSSSFRYATLFQQKTKRGLIHFQMEDDFNFWVN